MLAVGPVLPCDVTGEGDLWVMVGGVDWGAQVSGKFSRIACFSQHRGLGTLISEISVSSLRQTGKESVLSSLLAILDLSVRKGASVMWRGKLAPGDRQPGFQFWFCPGLAVWLGARPFPSEAQAFPRG